jgi:hypothetical protein
MLRGVDVVACAFRLSDAFLPESNGANLESMKNWVRVGWTLTALNFLILFLGFLIGVALWVETVI